jgi:hypothetical protein
VRSLKDRVLCLLRSSLQNLRVFVLRDRAAGQLEEYGGKDSRFLIEWVFLPVTRSVKPRDLARRLIRWQRMQHRQHERCPNPSTDPDDGAIAVPQSERAPRCAYFQQIADLHLTVKERTGSAVHLTFDTYGKLIQRAAWKEGALHTTLFEPFEILRRSNQDSNRKEKEIGGSGSGSGIWLLR